MAIIVLQQPDARRLRTLCRGGISNYPLSFVSVNVFNMAVVQKLQSKSPFLVMNWTNEELAFLSLQPSSLHSLFAHFSLFKCAARNATSEFYEHGKKGLSKKLYKRTILCREGELLLPVLHVLRSRTLLFLEPMQLVYVFWVPISNYQKLLKS